MIIIDTNIISALMRPDKNQIIAHWLDAQIQSDLRICSITVYEIHYGLAVSPFGHKREQLKKAFESQLINIFDHRVLAYDFLAAEHAAKLAAKRKLSGLNIELADTQIAGITLAHKAKLATRNIKHFVDVGIELINPWDVNF